MSVIVILGIIALVLISAFSSKSKSRGGQGKKQSQKMQISQTKIIYGSSPERSPERGQPRSEASWYPSGTAVDIKRFKVPDGMIYVGAGLGSGAASCFIDKTLAVATDGADISGSSMPYWPSYATIDPRCRLAYLQWLSSGKFNTEYSIGYIFLYFYGIERRLMQGSVDRQERNSLLGEIHRLRSIYGENNSFNRYSLALLDAAGLKAMLDDGGNIDDYLPDLSKHYVEMPLALKLVLAKKIVREERLTFEFAAAGFLSLPIVCGGPRLRIGATKSWGEFLRLLRIRFSKAFPEGFKLRNKKSSHLRLMYHAAAGNSPVPLVPYTETRDLPDPIDLTWTKMTDLVDRSMDDLAPYAKLASRHPERAGSLEAVALLPDELKQEEISTKYSDQITWLSGLPRPVAKKPLSELIKRFGGFEVADLRQQVALASFLETLGYGLEPNPLTSSTRLRPDDIISIFYFGNLSAEKLDPRPEYKLGTSIATLIAGIAGSSESGLGEQELKWLGWIARRLHLTELETIRLNAHVQWLASRRLTTAQLRKAISNVPADERGEIATFTAHVAAADGVVEKSEIAFLEKIYAELGVDRQVLYRTLHDISVGAAMPATDPVVVVPASKGRNGAAIPGAAPKTGGTVARKDRSNVKRIVEDTARVTDVLAKIFADEEDSDPIASKMSAKTSARFPDLDEAHADLVAYFLEADGEVIPRQSLEEKAKALGLLPGGALETVNDWSFDKYDEPLLEEEGDFYRLNRSLVEL